MARDVKQIAQQVHRTRATAVLGNDPYARWLADKPEILDELGRVHSDYALTVIARRICELRPAVAEAVQMIRRHREFDQLADEIMHTVEAYLKRHPNTPRRDILQAVDTARALLNRFGESQDAGRHQFLLKQPVSAQA